MPIKVCYATSSQHNIVNKRALAYLTVTGRIFFLQIAAFSHILLSLDRHISTQKADCNFRLILIDLKEWPCICPPSQDEFSFAQSVRY